MFTKDNVSIKEYKIHKYVYNQKIVKLPKPISYDKEQKIFVMQKIQNMCIADFYGENPKNIPEYIFEQIRTIIKTLFENNIMYPDITGYNFIELGSHVYIVDFGHAYFEHNIEEKNKEKFIVKFIDGLNEWNPDFR